MSIDNKQRRPRPVSRGVYPAGIAMVVGIVVGQLLEIAPPPPRLEFGLHLPHLTVPSWQDVVHGTTYAVLPKSR